HTAILARGDDPSSRAVVLCRPDPPGVAPQGLQRLSRGDVPNASGVVERRRYQEAAARRIVDVRDATGVSCEFAERVARGDLDEPHFAVAGPDGNTLRVGREVEAVKIEVGGDNDRPGDLAG